MDLSFTAEQQAFRVRLRAWLEENVPRSVPEFTSYEQEVDFLSDWQRRVHAGGWCGLSWPEAFGGAGSDLAGLRTRAEADGDGFRLTGQKVWTSYAQFSQFAICLARTDPTLAKHKGITYFIVDMSSPGIDIRPLRQITGDAEFNEVFLDSVYVPREYVIGGVNNGWSVAMDTLAHERGTNYLFKEQVNNRIAIDRLLDSLRRRRAAGERLDPALVDEVARAFIRVEIMRLHNLDTMTRLERGEAAGPETSLKKEFWTQLSQHLHETALRAQGAFAQLEPGEPRAVDGGRWQRSFLYSRSWSISGGTSEVQLNIIATRLLGLPRGA